MLVLHVAYAFVPIGFLLTGAAALWPDACAGERRHSCLDRRRRRHDDAGGDDTREPRSYRAGACGPLATQAIYAMALAAALLRILAAFSPDVVLLHIAALAWVAAFGGFAVVYGPLLVRARRA